MAAGPPSVFISYSWDSDEHKTWVRELAERLVSNGVHVTLDQWDLQPGDSLTQFMEAQIAACDFVAVICTPTYARKSNERASGVGYEQQIISGHLAAGVERRKFIPIVREGDMKAGKDLAIPSHFLGILAIDMRGPDSTDRALEGLLRAIFKVPAAIRPKLGQPPQFALAAATGIEVKAPPSSMRLATVEFDGWHLNSGQALSEAYPDTFYIPDAEKRSAVVPTDFVKLVFETADFDPETNKFEGLYGERMWVKVEGSYGPYFWGTLSNQPSMPLLSHGDPVVFLPEHIVDIMDAAQQERDEREFHARVKADGTRKAARKKGRASIEQKAKKS
jgi:hypothetical protein